MIDTITPADEADAQAAADAIAENMAGEHDEPTDEPAATIDESDAARPDEGTHGTVEPAAPSVEVIRRRFEAAKQEVVASDPDLALATQPELWQQYAETDPRGFVQWRARAEAKMQQIAAVDGELRLQEERAKLAKAMPDFANEKTAKAARAGMQSYLAEAGFSPQEIAAIGDHRILKVIADAQRGRALTGPAKNGRRASVAKALASKSIHDQATILAKLL